MSGISIKNFYEIAYHEKLGLQELPHPYTSVRLIEKVSYMHWRRRKCREAAMHGLETCSPRKILKFRTHSGAFGNILEVVLLAVQRDIMLPATRICAAFHGSAQTIREKWM